MSQVLQIHPVNPQPRFILRAVDTLRAGGIIVYPTDSTYALACHMGDKAALDRIRQLRRLDDKHNFTLVCRDLSEIASYAKVDNVAYRLLKHLTPGPYTFLLKATHEVPRRLQHPKRKTIGIRVPDNLISQMLLTEMNEPLMSTTLMLPGDDLPLSDPDEFVPRVEKQVDLILDAGASGLELTTVVDLVEGVPQLVRQGKGEVDFQ